VLPTNFDKQSFESEDCFPVGHLSQYPATQVTNPPRKYLRKSKVMIPKSDRELRRRK